MAITNNVSPYQIDDRGFYEKLRKGLKLNEQENHFKFYHLEGMHYPWILDENLEPLKNGKTGSALNVALGRLKIVQEYIEQMKNDKIYDNATIAVLADHGYSNMLWRRPVFFVKHPYVRQQHLTVNNKPVIVADLMPIVFQSFSSKESLKKAAGSLTHEYNRYFYYETNNGELFKYKVNEAADDKSSWVLLGKVNQYRDGDKDYEIGENIDFSFYGNSTRYKGYGWVTSPSERFSVTQDKAELIFDLKNGISNNNYIIKMKVNPAMFLWLLPHKKMRLYANDIAIGEWLFERDEDLELACELSGDLLKNQSLVLRFVVDIPEELREDERISGRGDIKLIVYSMRIVENNK